MGIPSDPGDCPFDSAFKAFLTSSSNIPLSHSSHICHLVYIRFLYSVAVLALNTGPSSLPDLLFIPPILGLYFPLLNQDIVDVHQVMSMCIIYVLAVCTMYW